MNNPVRLSRNTVKYIAVAAMTCNHIASALLTAGTPLYELLTDIGYFTALAMTYFLAEGYRFTSDLRRYKGRLLTFGLLAQVPYYLAFEEPQANFLFTLLLCLYINQILATEPRSEKRSLKLTSLIALSVFCDWSCIPALFTVFLSKAQDRKGRFMAFVYAALIFGGFSFLSYIQPPYSCGTAAAAGHAALSMIMPVLSGAVCVYLYEPDKRNEGGENNGNVIPENDGGPSAIQDENAGSGPAGQAVRPGQAVQPGQFRQFHKWFFYIYYPAHLAVLAAIKFTLMR